MTAPLRPPPRYCKICRSPLASRMAKGAFGAMAQYAHPAPADHEAVPVPRDDIDPVLPKCDFCSDPDTTTIFPTTEGAVSEVVGSALRMSEDTVDGQAGWVACAICADMLEHGRYQALRDRAVDAMLKTLPLGTPRSQVQKAIVSAHGSFRKMRTGKPGQPWPARQPTSPTD